MKKHTLIDLRGSTPSVVAITTGKVNDVKMMDKMPIQEDAVYTMDHGCVDYARLYVIHKQGAFFVIRAKDNLKFQRLYSKPKDKETGVRADQIITLKTKKSSEGYHEQLRRVSCLDKERKNGWCF